MDPFQTSEALSVLVVDDHGIVREGLIALLERCPSIRIVGSATNGREAVEQARRLAPDVVVMDLVLPEMCGIDATERIVKDLSDTRVVILSVCSSSEHVYRALRAGALGYVLKQAAVTELVDAVLAVGRGERFLSSQIADIAGDVTLDSYPRSPLERLSLREREVLQLTVAGITSAEIARRLFLSPKTVETYRSRIKEKLGVADQAALIRFAVQHDITP